MGERNDEGPYFVEVSESGCLKCGEGGLWAVCSAFDGEECEVLGTTFGDEETAADVCDAMNVAYRAGQVSASTAEKLDLDGCLPKPDAFRSRHLRAAAEQVLAIGFPQSVGEQVRVLLQRFHALDRAFASAAGVGKSDAEKLPQGSIPDAPSAREVEAVAWKWDDERGQWLARIGPFVLHAFPGFGGSSAPERWSIKFEGERSVVPIAEGKTGGREAAEAQLLELVRVGAWALGYELCRIGGTCRNRDQQRPEQHAREWR